MLIATLLIASLEKVMQGMLSHQYPFICLYTVECYTVKLEDEVRRYVYRMFAESKAEILR